LDGLLKCIENPVKNFSFMEYNMYTGDYAGTKITSINGGRFSADTGITTEILCNAQPKAMIRIGSCGSLSDDIRIGDLIVIDNAICGDGVTPYYVNDKDFEPQSDKALSDTLFKIAKASGINTHRGKTWSTDAILRETREHVGNAIGKGAIAVDMVTSTFLTICQQYNIPATAIMAVSDHIISGEMGFMDTNYYMAEHAMIGISLELIKQLEGQATAKA
jgi:purine-nucleoside phosphorylase